MRIVVALAAALSMFTIAEALAQNAMSPAPTKSSSAAPKAGAGAAPVGHRQPTPAEVGKADAGLGLSAEDKELDRKIKNICKGC